MAGKRKVVAYGPHKWLSRRFARAKRTSAPARKPIMYRITGSLML
jgi:hypothetical protein